ncbi:hypothetical protein GCM10018781_76430 [Kitasatospora indigofera]|uniref:Uncharacterized protein n=1 Tax=Kitasatospora indigofera TaxID=67307 RepID=A0A918YVQ3_9ACTN|nr:hypothetical protein [Kitasatospora indigofera]GHE25247.1 hypothetical protein GCM10018781_76430 [Kitasatospora indigofera]
MEPAALQELLIAHLPAVAGVESVVAWPARPYGLQVTLKEAGSVYWMISGASGVAPAAAEGERMAPQPQPELGGGKVATAQVEQALLTALAAADTDGQIVRADRYSTRPAPPTVGYGITVDAADTWRLFVACVGTARRGEELRASRHFQPDSDV